LISTIESGIENIQMFGNPILFLFTKLNEILNGRTTWSMNTYAILAVIYHKQKVDIELITLGLLART